VDFRLSQHAQQEMQRRAIPPALLQSVLHQPQQIVPEQGGRKAYQSQLDFGGGEYSCSERLSWIRPILQSL
jgi:hypothetical protein